MTPYEVKEYKLVMAASGTELTTLVNNLLRLGWVLHGAPLIYSGIYIAQALVNVE